MNKTENDHRTKKNKRKKIVGLSTLLLHSNVTSSELSNESSTTDKVSRD